MQLPRLSHLIRRNHKHSVYFYIERKIALKGLRIIVCGFLMKALQTKKEILNEMLINLEEIYLQLGHMLQSLLNLYTWVFLLRNLASNLLG